MHLFTGGRDQKRWLVVRKSTPKYHYLTLCIFQLMEAGGERDIEVGLLLCMYDCGASILFVHDSLY
jgi:hypothetical protein